MGLEAGGRGGAEEEKKEKEEEKIPHICESIGHRPLRGRCPKSDAWKVTTKLKKDKSKVKSRIKGKNKIKEIENKEKKLQVTAKQYKTI